jgi:hypothetical protein
MAPFRLLQYPKPKLVGAAKMVPHERTLCSSLLQVKHDPIALDSQVQTTTLTMDKSRRHKGYFCALFHGLAPLIYDRQRRPAFYIWRAIVAVFGVGIATCVETVESDP